MSIRLPMEYVEVATLAVAAALEDDDAAVCQLLHSLPPNQTAAGAEAAILAMAEMVRKSLTPEEVDACADAARKIARQVAQEGPQT